MWGQRPKRYLTTNEKETTRGPRILLSKKDISPQFWIWKHFTVLPIFQHLWEGGVNTSLRRKSLQNPEVQKKQFSV